MIHQDAGAPTGGSVKVLKHQALSPAGPGRKIFCAGEETTRRQHGHPESCHEVAGRAGRGRDDCKFPIRLLGTDLSHALGIGIADDQPDPFRVGRSPVQHRRQVDQGFRPVHPSTCERSPADDDEGVAAVIETRAELVREEPPQWPVGGAQCHVRAPQRPPTRIATSGRPKVSVRLTVVKASLIAPADTT